MSPRRARLLTRSLLAASIIDGGRATEDTFRHVLECSPAPPRLGRAADAVQAPRRAPAGLGGQPGRGHGALAARLPAPGVIAGQGPPAGRDLPLAGHRQPGGGAAARPGSRDQAAAFALAVYPAALAGALPIGAEGLADLGRLAGELLEVDGELAWSAHLKEHPELTRLAKVLDPLEPAARKQRARQLFYWAVLKGVRIPRPGAFEKELHATVEYLAGRVAA